MGKKPDREHRGHQTDEERAGQREVDRREDRTDNPGGNEESDK